MTEEYTGPLLLAGCGKMGGALLAGWLQQGRTGGDILVVDPAAARDGLPGGLTSGRVQVYPSAAALPAGLRPRVMVLAVKPQAMAGILPDYAGFAAAGTLALSIAAGLPLAFFARHLGDRAAVVRAMPNTPAAVGRGMTVCCGNARVSGKGMEMALGLMSAVGDSAAIDDESLMDAVTAVSGSGPAYVFLLAESLAAAGVRAGLPPQLAAQLARATVAGAGELARNSAEELGQLRENVTSPGGTTAAALEVLMRQPDGLPALLDAAVAAATRRSRELAG